MTNYGTLYLIPAPLSDAPLTDVIPNGALALILQLRHFVVEELRSARRYLSQAGHKGNIEQLTFFVLNEHTKSQELTAMLHPLLAGENMGLLSEAGLPAIADPGANLVALAHQKGILVAPLTGPSSLMLALMASGLNGQSFAFVGYLPTDGDQRKIRIRALERRAIQENQTQIFMETPYRNVSLYKELLELCAPQTMLCVASNLTAADAFVATKTVAQWRLSLLPPIHKIPALFLINNDYH